MSGPEIQASAISTLRDGRPLRDVSVIASALIIAALVSITVWLVWRSVALAAVAVPALALAYLGVAAALFLAGRVVPVVAPVLSIAFAAAGTLVLRRLARPRRRPRDRQPASAAAPAHEAQRPPEVPAGV
jgi:CHASE2 domain-containing sensor protein